MYFMISEHSMTESKTKNLPSIKTKPKCGKLKKQLVKKMKF